MNRGLKTALFFVLDLRSLILAFAVFNFVHVWLLSSNSCCCGVVNPWFCSWNYVNEPTLSFAGAVFLRINRIWANCVSCVLSGYLLGYFVWLFASYPAGLRVAFHYEWLSLKHQPFIDSWDSQYLLALIIVCCSVIYLARAILRWNALRRTADNKSLDASRTSGLLSDNLRLT
jgi:hypothetical protein